VQKNGENVVPEGQLAREHVEDVEEDDRILLGLVLAVVLVREGDEVLEVCLPANSCGRKQI